MQNLDLNIDVPTKRPELYYRGLAAWCKANRPRCVLEIGTEFGDSARSMQPWCGHVVSLDTVERRLPTIPDVTFRTVSPNECLSVDFTDFDMIFVDIDHSGAMERRIHDKLACEFTGTVFYDDVLGFPGMKSFWESIEQPKELLPWHGEWGFGAVRYRHGNLPAAFADQYRTRLWSLDYVLNLIQSPAEPRDYPLALNDIGMCLNAYAPRLFGKRIVVVGSISPWLECYLISRGALTVHSFDINPVQSQCASVVCINQREFMASPWDLIISYSSVEHFGLGRYGDEVSDRADIEFMQALPLAPGGIGIIAVPVAEEYRQEGHWHRIYDRARLGELLHGYEFLMSARRGVVSSKLDLGFFGFDARYEHNWQNQPTIVFRKCHSEI